jgi:hypothetical protein
MSEQPKGLALFVRAMSRSTVEDRVKCMADHGLTWAAIGTIWQERREDRWINEPSLTHFIVEACLRHGLSPYLWGYPSRGREIDFARDIGKCLCPGVVGLIPDPEVRFKATDDDHDGKVEPDEIKRAYEDARTLFRELVGLNPYLLLGFTSYGAVRGHPTLPWKAFFVPGELDPLNECAFAVPQLYDQSPARIRRGLEEYRTLGADVLVPGYSTYRFAPDGSTPRMTSTELDTHLGHFMALRSEFGFDAMIGWSETQVSRSSWKVLEKYASLLG